MNLQHPSLALKSDFNEVKIRAVCPANLLLPSWPYALCKSFGQGHNDIPPGSPESSTPANTGSDTDDMAKTGKAAQRSSTAKAYAMADATHSDKGEKHEDYGERQAGSDYRKTNSGQHYTSEQPDLIPYSSMSSEIWLELIECLEHAPRTVGPVDYGCSGVPRKHSNNCMAASQYIRGKGDSDWSLNELSQEVKCEGHAFSRMLFELMQSRNITPSSCYRTADVDRRYFSRLKSATAHPSRTVIIRFALALRLNLAQTRQLLATEGYTLSRNIPEDRALCYFIRRGIWSRFIINEALFALGLNTL